MKKIRELTVFTIGDSRLLKTWSNFPYFLIESLFERGIRINRINLQVSNLQRRFFKYFFYIFWNKISSNSTFDYRRSYLHFSHIKKQIKRAVKEYPDADANIFLTFSFSSYKVSNLPSILICDWPYDHYIRHFKEKSPDLFEKISIKRDYQQIAGSDLVILLFKSILPSMLSMYEDKKIKYLNQYVVNSLNKIGENEYLTDKKETHNILFVGCNNYLHIEGAKNLVSAFVEIKKKYPLAKLHIVGLNKSDFDQLPDGVTCYGYLDKGTLSGNQLYYSLLRTTNVYVNTNIKWSGLSTTVEAMYFHIPIVVYPYDEFISLFGEEINFGYYCYENTADSITDSIKKIFSEQQYIHMCRNAHLAVKDFTWSSYAGKLLDEIETVVNSKS